jgi:glutathione reductase (NADPH)
MTNKTEHYDFFVIGGGSGGVRAARIAAGYGAKVGLAESGRLGGTCVNIGCVPKKLLAYAADYGAHFEDARAFGWKSGKLSFDWKKLITNKDAEIQRLNGIYEKILTDAGVDIVRGTARFIDARTLEVGGRRITADKFLIATGGKPFIPAIPGTEHIKSSDDMFSLPKAPKHIVIMGGGYIAVEFAHIFAGVGSKVTQLYRGDLFLNGFDRDVRETLAAEMRKHRNIDLRFKTDIAKVEKRGTGYIVHTNDGNTIKCDLILAATGRVPNTAGLGLQGAGVTVGVDGRVGVDADYRTNMPHIYAVGDVCNHHNLTPVALAEGHVLADRLFGQKAVRSVDYEFIPTAVFSAPPIATVGYTEDGAKAKGYDVEVYRTLFRPLKHTVSKRDERTMMKLIVDKKSNRVIGAHMVGADAPEIMQGVAIAINAGATKAMFDRTIGIHPTAAEEFVTMRTPLKPK